MCMKRMLYYKRGAVWVVGMHIVWLRRLMYNIQRYMEIKEYVEKY